MVRANALILHLNPLQEAIQFGGNTDWRGLLDKIGDLAQQLTVPVIVKEVGWGLSSDVAHELAIRGVAALDVAGAGGTSWSEVERHLTPDERVRRVARRFADWGIPTAESLQMVKRAAPNMPVVASGGIRSGVDGAKALALGADLFGMASPFLKAAAVSVEAAIETAQEIAHELRIAMFLIGAATITDLRGTPHLRRLSTEEAIIMSRAES
jgi:isopentenyl-diphosphate delta-isomerase